MISFDLAKNLQNVHNTKLFAAGAGARPPRVGATNLTSRNIPQTEYDYVPWSRTETIKSCSAKV